MSERMNIGTALNKKYVLYTGVMLQSLFMNHPDKEIHVYLLHQELTEEDFKLLEELGMGYSVTFHGIRVGEMKFPKELPVTEMWSKETYFRLMMVDLLPQEVDRILYLDTDVIVNKSVEEFYRMDFEGKKFVVCKDMNIYGEERKRREQMFEKSFACGHLYFNAGVMLWNIAALRKKTSWELYMKAAGDFQFDLLALDQDLLNYVHWREVKYVDGYRYNLFARKAYHHGCSYDRAKEEAAIIHYTGKKPWDPCSLQHFEIEEIWWEYAANSPYYVRILQAFQRQGIESTEIEDYINELGKQVDALYAKLQENFRVNQELLGTVKQLQGEDYSGGELSV